MKLLQYLKPNLLVLILLTLSLIYILVPRSSVLAETLESTTYKIEGATLTGGDIGESTNYTLINTGGEIVGDPYAQGTTYQLNVGSTATFQADVPTIACFETTTDGSSSCTTGPTYLNSSGMVRICGPEGCYNKARIEIDAGDNPNDTLYGIQVSIDNFVSDVMQVDGVTLTPQELSGRTIADYKTESAWEATTVNILGLEAGQQYWARVTALHGDLTESSPSPVVTATTAYPSVEFDIDIAGMSGVSAETAAPYNIAFTGEYNLYAGGGTQTAQSLVWIDTNTNGAGGLAVLALGTNGGLYSSSGPYTITSANTDLDSTTEGFGIQNYDHSSGVYTDHYQGSGTGELGTVTVQSDYQASSINKVGILDTAFNKVYDGNGPILNGRMAMWVKAKAGNSAPAASDYAESVRIVVVPRY